MIESDDYPDYIEWNIPEINSSAKSNNFGKWYVCSKEPAEETILFYFLKKDGNAGIPISAAELDDYYYDTEDEAIGTIMVYELIYKPQMNQQGQSPTLVKSEPLFED